MTTLVHPGEALTRGQRLRTVLLLGAITILAPFTIDMYLPAFPAIERELNTTSGVVQLTLTATTIGFGLGQLLSGPWSDVVGRRLPLLLATSVHVLASIGVALSPEAGWLLGFRMLQGVGAAAGTVVAIAMVRDLFGGKPLVRMLGNLALVSGLGPILAPLVGSQLLLLTSWRGLFWVLVGYGALILVCNALFLRETLPPARRRVPGHSSVAQRYGAVFRDRVFVGVALVGAFMWLTIFAYLTSSPFLLQDVYGLDPQQYGLAFAANSVGVVVGVQTGSRLARRIPPQWVLMCGVLLAALAASWILVVERLDLGAWGVFLGLWFVIFSCGVTFPCTQVLALAHHGAEAGTAASLLGAINFTFAGLVSPLLTQFAVRDAVPMATTMVLALALALVALFAVVRPRSVPSIGR